MRAQNKTTDWDDLCYKFTFFDPEIVERMTPLGWQKIPVPFLVEGNVFRIFESDGSIHVDNFTKSSLWIVINKPYPETIDTWNTGNHETVWKIDCKDYEGEE